MVTFDTKLPGLSNKGHSDKKVFFGGIDFKKTYKKKRSYRVSENTLIRSQ